MMRRLHRTVVSKSNPLATKLGNLLSPKTETKTTAVFELDEASESWSQVSALLHSEKASDSVRTEFTDDEVQAAEWLEIVPAWHWSYPMPDDDALSYLKEGYDLSCWCPRCHVGAVQVNPFRLTSEPKWGSRHFLQLNWVFDEYFVRPEVWDAMQAAGLRGIAVTPPVSCRTGKPMQTILQLRVNCIPGEGLEEMIRKFTICGHETVPKAKAHLPGCGRRIYDSCDLGPLRLRASALAGQGDMIKTTEWFGYVPHHKILISRKFGRLIMDNKWRGIDLRPIEMVAAVQGTVPGSDIPEKGEKKAVEGQN